MKQQLILIIYKSKQTKDQETVRFIDKRRGKEYRH